MIYCLIFLENNAKKKKNTVGLMCFDFVKPFCTQDPYVVSSGNDILPASFPFFSNKTVLDNLVSTNWVWDWRAREWGRRKKSLELFEKQQYVCMGCKFSCDDHMVGVVRLG